MRTVYVRSDFMSRSPKKKNKKKRRRWMRRDNLKSKNPQLRRSTDTLLRELRLDNSQESRLPLYWTWIWQCPEANIQLTFIKKASGSMEWHSTTTWTTKTSPKVSFFPWPTKPKFQSFFSSTKTDPFTKGRPSIDTLLYRSKRKSKSK